MSPDAEDASPSPEPGAEQDPSGIMAEETKQERASTEEKSPNAQASNGNANSSQTAKSNAKDPSRPRRKKARRACFACQRAHLTCGKSSRLASEPQPGVDQSVHPADNNQVMNVRV